MDEDTNRSWRSGFQDALELALAEIGIAKTKEDIEKKLKEYYSLVLQDKLERLRQELFNIKA